MSEMISIEMIVFRLKEHMCVIVLTHSKALMEAVDCIHLLNDGKILSSGSYQQLETESYQYEHIRQTWQQISKQSLC